MRERPLMFPLGPLLFLPRRSSRVRYPRRPAPQMRAPAGRDRPASARLDRRYGVTLTVAVMNGWMRQISEYVPAAPNRTCVLAGSGELASWSRMPLL